MEEDDVQEEAKKRADSAAHAHVNQIDQISESASEMFWMYEQELGRLRTEINEGEMRAQEWESEAANFKLCCWVTACQSA